MRRLILAPLVAALACGGGLARADGWPSADCPSLLSTGHPRPAWGSKEKLSQEALLMLINYQLAIGACQQDEMLKTLRQQGKLPELPRAPKAEPAVKAPRSEEPFPRLEGAKPDEPKGPLLDLARP